MIAAKSNPEYKRPVDERRDSVVPTLHLGKYFRYLWEEKDLLIVEGRFSEVAVSRRLYEERHGVVVADASADKKLVELMGAAALAAVSLADRESWGWTVTFEDAPFGYFVGVEPEGMICGRVREADTTKNAALIQRQKAPAPLTQSHFEPRTADPAATVQQYFEQSVQVKTRIVLDEEASGVLVQSLPGGRFEAVSGMEDAELLALLRKLAADQVLKPVGEVLVFYECRCDDEMVLNMVTSLPEKERREIFGDGNTLTMECPRCGRTYEIQRPLH